MVTTRNFLHSFYIIIIILISHRGYAADCNDGSEDPTGLRPQGSSVSSSFELMCSDKILTGYDTLVDGVRSLIDCAMWCANSDTCIGFNYMETIASDDTVIYCGLVDMRVEGCNLMIDQIGAQHFALTSPHCSKAWNLVLNTSKEITVEGSENDLIYMVTQGFPIRIGLGMTDDQGVTQYSLYDTDSVWVKDGHVAAQVYTWSPPLGYYRGSEPTWTLVNVISNGILSLEEHEDYGTQTNIVNIEWYVKKGATKCRQPVSLLEMTPYGDVIQGSVSNVLTAIASGYPLQIVEKWNEAKLRSYPVSWASVDMSTDGLYMASSWVSSYSEIGMETGNLFTNEIVTFSSYHYNPTHFYVKHNIKNGNDSTVKYVHEEGTFALVVDICWHLIFVNDGTGISTQGSMVDLLHSVTGCKELRVSYRETMTNIVTTPKIVRVTFDGITTITAYTGRTYVAPFADTMDEWVQEEISSTGIINRTVINRKTGAVTKTSFTATIAWFVEKNPLKGYFNPMTTSTGYMPAVLADMDALDGGTNNPSSLQLVYSQELLMVKASPYSLGIDEYRIYSYRSFNGTELTMSTFVLGPSTVNVVEYYSLKLIGNALPHDFFTYFPQHAYSYA